LNRSDVRRLRARLVFAAADRRHENAEVVVAGDGHVLGVRRLRPAERRTAVDVALVPGLVDLHTHLQLAPLPDAGVDAAVRRSFPAWIRAVLGARFGSTSADFDRGARHGVRQRLTAGAVAFGEIDSTGRTRRALRGSPVTVRTYRELTGFDVLDDAAARARVAEAVRPAAERPTRARGPRHFGLSPHAPYSTSAPLCRAAARAAALQIHVAEIPEEVELLRTGRGPLRELLEELGRWPAGFRPPGCGPVAWLEGLGVLAPGAGGRHVLVHAQELERGDVERIAGSGAAIAVCPGTIRWFGRAAPDVESWRRAGIRVGLGTDSAASNDEPTLLAAMREARSLWPGLAPGEILAMATEVGADALAVPGVTGRIEAGSRADLLVVPLAEGEATTPERFLERFTHGAAAPTAVLLSGTPADDCAA
jgi:cytosine/adenosine deaminase-related metal-dependent hydrolase